MIVFEDYVKQLVKLLEERPETAKFNVVFAKNNKGSKFNIVRYMPSIGFFDNSKKCDFLLEDYFDDQEWESNAVCVN